MLFPRNLLVVAALSPSLARLLVVPFAAMAGVGVAVTGLLWARLRRRRPPAGELDTAFRLRPALAIGAVLAAAVGVALPSHATRTGVVSVTLLELVVYVAITRTAGAERMARAVAAILFGSATLGLAFVLA